MIGCNLLHLLLAAWPTYMLDNSAETCYIGHTGWPVQTLWRLLPSQPGQYMHDVECPAYSESDEAVQIAADEIEGS